MEQWVFFESRRGGGTRIHTWGELTGMMPLIAGRTIKDLLFESRGPGTTVMLWNAIELPEPLHCWQYIPLH